MSEIRTAIIVDVLDRFTGPSKKITAALNKVANNQKAIERFKALKGQTHQTALAWKQATDKVAKLSKKIKASAAPSAALVKRFAQAKAQASKLKKEHQAQSKSLQGLRTELTKAGLATNALNKHSRRLTEQSARLNRVLKRHNLAGKALGGVAKGVGVSVNKIKQFGAAGLTTAKWGGGILAGLGFAFKRTFVDTAAEFERFRTILTTVEGSSVKAKTSMDWISDFAVKTPYELAAVTDAFVKLRAYGLDPKNGLLKTLGDTSAAMGKPIMQAVEAIADAVTGENERLKEFGIKAAIDGDQVRYEYTDKAGKQQFKAVDKNNRALIQSTLEAIWNEKYAGAMGAQSKTWEGMLSNLSDQWTRFKQMVMDAGVFDQLKSALNQVLDKINQMAKTGALQALAKDVAEGLIPTIKTLWVMFKGVGTAITAIMGVAKMLWQPFEKLASLITAIIEGVDKILGTNISNTIGRFTARLLAHFTQNKEADAALLAEAKYKQSRQTPIHRPVVDLVDKSTVAVQKIKPTTGVSNSPKNLDSGLDIPADIQIARPTQQTQIDSHDSYQLTINQQAGEDAEGLARRVADELERHKQAASRAALYDEAIA